MGLRYLEICWCLVKKTLVRSRGFDALLCRNEPVELGELHLSTTRFYVITGSNPNRAHYVALVAVCYLTIRIKAQPPSRDFDASLWAQLLGCYIRLSLLSSLCVWVLA